MAVMDSGSSSWSNLDARLRDRLQEVLDALMELTGASAGWIGLNTPDRGLHFPVRGGAFPDAWLALQQGQATVWGFTLLEGPTLLNDLPAVPVLGEPPLYNLLSCAVPGQGEAAGHIVLANKAAGFTSHDALVLQSLAHLVGKRVGRGENAAGLDLPASLLQRTLDQAEEGIVVLSRNGRLLYANATWTRWTGFSFAEMRGRAAPLPFWPSLLDLTTLAGTKPGLARGMAVARPAEGRARPGEPDVNYLPFRHRTQGLFWCRAEVTREIVEGEPLTIARLRRLPVLPALSQEVAGHAISFQALADQLPFAAFLTDREGRILWVNSAFAGELVTARAAIGSRVMTFLTSSSAAALERLLHEDSVNQASNQGRLLLQWRDGNEQVRDLVTYWQAVTLPKGSGVLFALAEDWQGMWFNCDTIPGAVDWLPMADTLALLLGASGVEFWGEDWERLTGLTAADVAGVPSDVLLDWLFPQQREREFVTEILSEPRRRGAQATLEMAGREGGRSFSCTFLPLQPGGRGSAAAAKTGAGSQSEHGTAPPGREGHWLLLARAPRAPVSETAEVQQFLRQFTRGISHLLNHYLTAPVGLAESALDRADLPADLAGSFHQILESCMRASRLIAALQDLAAHTPGDRQLTSLAALVKEFLTEHAAEAGKPAYAVQVEAEDADGLVEINPRMIKAILRSLLVNAEEALAQQEQQRIRIRVYGGATEVRCEIRDSGPGLPADDWTATLAPFYSTKGAFARDVASASIDALGLGLTVSQHLAALHGGRIELQSVRGEGTRATLILPRAGASAEPAPRPVRLHVELP
jgi:signal transduction histidine kinase/PAS domain-containing protein